MDKPAGDYSSVLENVDENASLEEVLLKVEEAVSGFLSGKLPRDVDYRLVLKIEKNDAITLHVDIELISSSREELIGFKLLIDDAIRLAKSVFEELIKRSSQ